MSLATLPDSFDGYVLRKLLGRGGMGEVHLAHDTLLDRPVAIKLIATEADEEARRRFLVEARAVARLEHPNVVGVYRVGEIEGIPYLVSEFVRGTPLDELPRPVSSKKALEIAMDLVLGLATAHRRGVVHRDIKPANAILGDDGRVKLLDFGIAKLLESGERAHRLTPAPRESDAPSAADAERAEEATRAEGLQATGPTRAPAAASPETTHTEGMLATGPTRAPRATTAGLSQNDEPAEPAGTGREQTPRTEPAVDLTRTGVTLGTPRYMAPEVWRGEVATFRSDIYSLGALLYTLCADRPVYPASSIEELREKVLHEDAAPLASVASGVDPRLARIVDRCLERDATDRFEDAGALRHALSELLPGARGSIVPEGNPYRGLRAFESEHSNLFFGRDSETRMVLDRLVSEPFVLIAGDSGVGKSSLCRAGVVPRLSSWLDDDRAWELVTFVPGRHPVTALAAALAQTLGRDEKALARQISDDPSGVARALRGHTRGGLGVVLLIDQLEELVTLSERREADAVSELLGWLAIFAAGTRLLATVRGDFLSRIAQLPRVGEVVSRALFFLRPLSKERIEEAIVGPAEAKGVSFEDPELVQALVASTARAGDGGLPLLQFALAELWEARGDADVISAGTLARVGGVGGALSRHADDVIAQMLPDAREAARRILTSLVSPRGTRSRLLDRELELGDEAVDRALSGLVRGRLVVARDSAEGTSYEIAHEALIEHWETLRQWRSSDADARLAAERLRAAVGEWERLEGRRDALWSERRLAEIDRLGLALTEREKVFVRLSRRQHRRAKVARVAMVAAVPLLAILVWGIIETQHRWALDERIDGEIAAADAILSEAEALHRQTLERRQEALAAFDAGRIEPAEELWQRHRASLSDLEDSHRQASKILEGALALDMSREEVRDRFASLLLRQAEVAELAHEHQRRDELVDRLALFDDGSRQQIWSAPARLALEIEPPEAELSLFRYQLVEQRYQAEPVGDVASFRASPEGVSLAPGSYLLVAEAPGHAPVRLPLWLGRGAERRVSLRLLPTRAVPEGFVHVPAGHFLVGSDADDIQRRDFFHTVPLHEVSTPAFLVSRHETTFGDWLHYLNDLEGAARDARTPRVGEGGFKGSLRLERRGERWRIRMQPTTVALVAEEGERITYPGRGGEAHDWRALPVVGITAEDAERYAAWLRHSERVPGARLCSELEWERAARGADGRPYPHGTTLVAHDANHDATYGRVAEAMGPDEVGSHPASQSPFGLHDMAGNVWEWTRSSHASDAFVARGGSWYFGPSSSHVADREETEASFRDLSVGLRLCADAPAANAAQARAAALPHSAPPSTTASKE